MSAGDSQPTGPDLAAGVEADSLANGQCLEGHVGSEAVLLARSGDQFFALGAKCSHYGGPLAEGLVVGDTVRCPWHHACFSLRTGEAIRAPALNPVDRWTVERAGSKVQVTTKAAAAPVQRRPRPSAPRRVVIVGGGAAGNAAAELLRREGFDGSVTLLSADTSVPYDRPNLSKDYLAGTAPEEWIPLRSPEFYAEQGIELRLGTRVAAIAPARREVTLECGQALPYDALPWRPAPVRFAPGSLAPTCPTSSPSAAWPMPGPSSPGQGGEPGAGTGGELHRSRLRQRSEIEGWKCTSPRRRACPWSGCWAPTWAASSARSTRAGVVFHLGRTAQSIDRTATLSMGPAWPPPGGHRGK
jgi:nitrite reductase/ring-hydroxylating ferredoxin subunit